jgi:hypothetical protein
MKRREFIKMIAGVAALCPIAAGAETYPSRPITMVVPFAAGGGFDVIGRIVAVSMSRPRPSLRNVITLPFCGLPASSAGPSETFPALSYFYGTLHCS